MTHWYDFGSARPDLDDPTSWDSLRASPRGPFALPATVDAWDALVDADDAARLRARAIHEILSREAVETVASYGVGTAVTERCLWRLDPTRRLVLTEFAPVTRRRLAELFPEADVRTHDLRDEGPYGDVALHLLLRVDTELDNREFRMLLRRFADVRVLVVATEVLTPRTVIRELLTRRRRHAVRAGTVRSGGCFEDLFCATHCAKRLVVGDLPAWLLDPRGE